jgi:hypothetical protein
LNRNERPAQRPTLRAFLAPWDPDEKSRDFTIAIAIANSDYISILLKEFY